ncbi:MAG: Uma2 family endonuclease [Syntrophomonadaceae bacterium]|nr:Uma2 family endonuclease [Syntrophomonadaceae bacterium]
MSISSPKPDKKYTYADYLSWPSEERWEIINGVPSLMSPAPLTEHQRILGELFVPLALYFKDKKCRVFPAPFDVRLPKGDEKDEEISSVVQPDIVVVCDPNKLDERGCKGAPDLVVEILSSSTAKKDLNEKFNLYEQSKIRQYWVVFPKFQVIDIYSLDESGQYEKTKSFSSGEQISSELFPGLEIDLDAIFSE